jgi:hypothetical protein
VTANHPDRKKEKAMWVRQCDLDARSEAPPPVPARITSNEEFLPPPQSPRQREYEATLTPRSHPTQQKAE